MATEPRCGTKPDHVVSPLSLGAQQRPFTGVCRNLNGLPSPSATRMMRRSDVGNVWRTRGKAEREKEREKERERGGER
jgi:hypothetical protein